MLLGKSVDIAYMYVTRLMVKWKVQSNKIYSILATGSDIIIFRWNSPLYLPYMYKGNNCVTKHFYFIT